MTILLTNDDGVDSPGIKALYDSFCKNHNVWIMAPDGDRKGGIESSDLSGEDSSAILKGNISISSVFLQPVNHLDDEMYKTVEFKRIVI
ncbi:MAG: hypothetical protein JXR86_20980 [Spirochaetales bacterium]|nr:hypothetical protein [Spirochaetales bacterium]